MKLQNVQYEDRERISFLTDSQQLNDALGGHGIESGNLVVVQAPTGDGKTTFMMRLAILASKEHKVAYISCGEQDIKELSVRFAKMIRSKKYEGVHKESYDPADLEEEEEFLEHSKCWENLEIYYEEDDLCNTVKQALADGAKFIFVDYLGCLLAERQDQQYAFLSRVASWLKTFATDNNIGIITAMQTNRSLLRELKESDFDPEGINEEFMADSIGVAKKATICISWFRKKDTRYLVLFKNRFNGEKLSIQVEVNKYSYKWTEMFKPEAGF